jgi:two-component system sensor histidine kinase FlrB
MGTEYEDLNAALKRCSTQERSISAASEAMTSLPMPDCLPACAEIPRGSEQFLLKAFRSFAEAAESLERSYGMLRSEVARLHGELEQSNAGLASSLQENRQMREHLDRILDGLPCGVLVAGSDGIISRLNPEGRRLLGPSLAKCGAASVLDSSVDAILAVPGELLERLRQARSEPGEQEWCLSDGCGAERWLAVRHASLHHAGQSEREQPEQRRPEQQSGEAVSIFILRDVSDAKRLVRERDKLRREQALAEMSAILAHEIRNPLGSLELFAGLLAGAGLSRECRQWVEHVQAGLRTLSATVNNVLHFHSLPVPQRVPIDLGELLDWAGGFLAPMARQARVELCLRNRLHGATLAADRHRLEQVLLNLVLNALRAMPGGGWVEICGQRIRGRDGMAAVISVSDTGPGVEAEHEEKIFAPGFSTRAGSPGLGLAVCRKIVEQHGGSLAAGNRPGAGASFTLTFRLEETWEEEIRQEVAG